MGAVYLSRHGTLPRGFLLLLLLAPSSFALAEAPPAPEIRPLTEQQRKDYTLDAGFYKKCILVQNILVVSSDRVSDYTLREAAYLLDLVMQDIKPPIAQRIRDKKVICILVGHDEQISDLPQFPSEKKGQDLGFYNWRNRGFLELKKNGHPTAVFAEEDVLEYEGGQWLESVLIHEFAHVIDGAGFDDNLHTRLHEAFQHAKIKGLWNDGYAAQHFERVTSATPVSLLDALVKAFPNESPELLKKCLDGGDVLVNGKPVNAKAQVTKDDKIWIVFGGPKNCYAALNAAEYWAESVQCWYNCGRINDHDHNHIHTREGLKSYDPEMAKLCEDVLGDSAWRFASPRDRAGKGHLAGYDPAAAPSVVKPPYIAKARLDYYDDYWKSYWQRLRDKYTPTLGALTKDSRILFQGDSITDGNRGRSADPNHILGHGYAFIIAAKYGAAFPERNLDFVNRGNSGNTVLDLQNRWKNDTLALKPNLLSVLIGVNDNARDVPLQQYEKVYDKLLADVRAANPSVKLVLCEPFGLPVGKRKENWDAWSSSLQKRREAVARLAEKHHAALVHFQKAFDAACQRAPAEHWIWDGVHPTYSGHQIMADEWIHTVDQFWPVAKQTNPK